MWYNGVGNEETAYEESTISAYCYTTDDGQTVERVFPMGEAPRTVWVDGKAASRDYQAEQVKVPATAGWPMPPCVASGVNAEQSGELRDFLRKCGVPTEVYDGDPIYRSKSHREKALRARGIADRN